MKLTPQQQKQAEHAQKAIIDEFNMLARQGVPIPAILTGTSMALADLFAHQGEAKHLATWFQSQAKLITHLQQGDG